MSKSIIISSKSENFILTHGNKIILETKCFPSDILIITVEPDIASIGIKKMSELKKWSSIKPFNSKNKIAFIHHAHLLTPEAQNSILKLLEEPSQDTYVVLTTINHHLLLPTILSRCQIIIDNSVEKNSDLKNITEFLSLPLMKKFTYLELLEKETDKKTAIDKFLELLLKYFREKLLSTKDTTLIKKLTLISQAKKMINAKVSSKNALENLIIQLDT